MATIIVDMDDTIVDFKGALIRKYNELRGTDYTVENMTNWDMESQFPGITAMYKEEGFFRNLPAYDHAIDVIDRLSRKHEIIIVTASAVGYSMKEKGEWFQEHLSFLGPDNFIIARKKYKIKADVMFDDGPHNIDSFPGITIAIPHAHNTHAQPDYWVRDLRGFERVINSLYDSYHVLE